MRSSATATCVGMLALTAALSGCISGAFFPAEPASLAVGWTKDNSSSESGERGLPPLVVAKYQVNAYTGGVPTGLLYVVSVSDVPLVDEQGEIQKELDARLTEKNVQLTERQKGSGSVGSDAAAFIWYDAVVPLLGKGYAVDARYTCAGNGEAVRIFGFASTEGSSGLFGGGSTDLSSWEELVGRAFPTQLGGMAASVRCS